MRRFVPLLSLILASFVFSVPALQAAEQAKAKKKLYISTIAAKQGASAALADKVRDLIQITILEKYGQSYKIISTEDVKVMFERAEVLQAAGCNDQNCNVELAQLISADELIYGTVTKEGGKVAVSLTNLASGKSAKDTQVKSMVRLSFDEDLSEGYCREAATKLIDPGYRIGAMTSLPRTELKLPNAVIDQIQKGKTLKAITFKADDTALAALVEYYQKTVEEGDEYFRKGDYTAARSRYKSIVVSSATKLTEDTRTKMKDFFSEVDHRITQTFATDFYVKLSEVDSELKGKKGEVSEKDLLKAVDRYEKILAEVAENSDAGTTTVSNLKPAVSERVDAILQLVIGQHIKLADEKYKRFEFSSSLDELVSMNRLLSKMYDPKIKESSKKTLLERYTTIMGTACNYLVNRVESMIVRAQYFNVIGNREESISAMKAARDEITGPLRVFATVVLIAEFNDAAGLLNSANSVAVKPISETSDAKVYKAMFKYPSDPYAVSSDADSSDDYNLDGCGSCIGQVILGALILGFLIMLP